METTNEIKNFRPLSNMETSAFCSQIAMILKAGISSIEGISIMADDAENTEEKELLKAIYDTLLQTGSLYLALSDTNAFPKYMLSMIQLGEATGRLDEVTASLASYYEKEANLAQSIKNAITYPFIMILMMIAVILVLITKVMPVFDQVFRQLGTEMSGVSKAILNIGTFFNRHAIVLIVILALILFFGFYLIKTKKGQEKLLSFSGKFNLTRMLNDKISAYRFANGMALTLSSGLPPEECLNLTSGLISDEEFQKKVASCQEQINSGADLCESLLSCGIFSGLYTKMASIAGRTGVMDEVMNKIADQYEDEIDNKINKLLSSIEPTLVVILSVIVGIILLSVMLPLMNIMSAL